MTNTAYSPSNAASHDLSKPGVHGLGAAYLRLPVGGVTDHVTVRNIGDDQVESFLDPLSYSLGDPGQAEFWNLVEWSAFRRRDADILLAGIRLDPPAIEEESDVSEFLGLGDAQLGEPRSAEDLPERVHDSFGSEGYREVLEFLMVQREDDEGQVAKWAAWKVVPGLIDEGLGQLDFALPAATTEDHRVAVRHAPHRLPLIVHQHDRLERVVGLPFAVQGAHGLGQRQAASAWVFGRHGQVLSARQAGSLPKHRSGVRGGRPPSPKT